MHGVGDRRVLHGPQLGRGHRPGGSLARGPGGRRRAQQAADLLGTERRVEGAHPSLVYQPSAAVELQALGGHLALAVVDVSVTSAHTPKRLAEPE